MRVCADAATLRSLIVAITLSRPTNKSSLEKGTMNKAALASGSNLP